MKTIWAGIAVFSIGIGCGCGVQLDPLLLMPSSTFRLTPVDVGYPYQEVMLSTISGSKVNAWHVRTDGTSRGIVVCIPGADSNKGRYSLLLPIFVDKGWDVLLYDYPGFGNSPGSASLLGVMESSRAAMDYAFEQEDVVVGYGLSMGTDVLGRLAADYDLAACIFDSAGNMREIGSNLLTYHGIPAPIGSIADIIITANTSDDFDIKRWIKEVKAPKLFLHSPDDTLTPWERAWEIFKLAPQPKHIVATQGDHAEQIFVDPNMYRSLINGWLDGALKLDPIQHPDYQRLLDDELRATLKEFGLAPAN